MPLLKRKRYPLVQPPPYDPTKKESMERQVWYSGVSHEIYEDYATYLQRQSLYRRPIWQCESTGRSNLTFKQAMESERVEKERVQDKLPEQLRKRVLERAQFQTTRLDAVVDDVYNYFLERYTPGEIVSCMWDDGIMYNARILDVYPANEDKKANGSKTSTSIEMKYKVQLIDEFSEGIEDCIKTAEKSDLKRDRLAYSKNLLKKFIRECTTRDSYIGAPWLINPLVAEKYNIDTTLPYELQEAKDNVHLRTRRKKPLDVPVKKGALQLKDVDARKLEASLKYPMEDLDLPAYRRNPSGLGPIIDMTPRTEDSKKPIPNPTGGLPVRVRPSGENTVPAECFGSFLMVWCFLSVFARSLDLYPFGLDEFENALRHNSSEIKSQILIESNVCLLNAIIKQRRKSKVHSNGALAAGGNLALLEPVYGSGYQSSRSTTPVFSTIKREESGSASQYTSGDEQEETAGEWFSQTSVMRRSSLMERGCGSEEVCNIGHNWDARPIRPENDRAGWEDILIGCINHLAPLEQVPDFDRILSHLIPRADSTLEDREEAYLTLSLKDKIKIFELLVSAVNECSFIKEYMEECQDQMTELRKQKIELSRERKRIYAARIELEKSADEAANSKSKSEVAATTTDSENELNESDSEDIETLQRHVEHASRHESRQAILKRKQAEREEREAKRIKMHHRQREEARVRTQEQRARTEARKKLDEEERQLHRKEEQVERDMRRYSTLRIKPLGRDKFFNRYFYLDNIGGGSTHGSGRLYIQSPSEIDLMTLRGREEPESVNSEAALPCGRGGGISFVCELMRGQGLEEESRFLEQRISDTTDTCVAQEWWETYQYPEELENLMDWLNPKGVREYRLKRELEKHMHSLITGMKKRVSEQNASKAAAELPRRTTRSKTVPQIPTGSWLAGYANAKESTDYAFEMAASNIRFGPGATSEIGMDIDNIKANKVAVYTDSTIAKLHPLKAVVESLEKHKVNYVLYEQVRIEPTDTSFKHAIEFARQQRPDAFIAVGGGSVMDTAKAANLYSAHPEAEFLDFVNAPIGKGLPVKHTLKPLIAVPTTAGTGSETTGTAVFDYEPLKTKTGIAHRALKPMLGIVDPLNTRTMPPEVHAASGLDVLCHALESYTALPYNLRSPRPSNPMMRPAYQGSNPISDVWSLHALKMVVEYLPRAVKDPEDTEAQTQMLLAATFAGIGFGNAGVHLCHGLSYPISGLNKRYKHPGYDVDHPIVPHGVSVALTAPAVFRFTSHSSPERHIEAAVAFGADRKRMQSKDVAGDLLAEKLTRFLHDLGMPNGLSALGYNESHIPALVEGTLPQQRITKLAPGREPAREHLAFILENAMTNY
ncbi:hypothetical protein EC973_007105 [Apophysomyces ossiformis]|uniref:hydroxyacid-oxoacid transhydrogenase n=1 Tax=Apophysomyces ossiformis TaxID=679940 RepID=A0A8H7ET06_9FUNG|nr:hypothetical protein EC973_007105 [Apophysomyces ossiformis]